MTDSKPGILENLGLLPEEEVFEETLSELCNGRGDDEDD